MSFPVVLPRDRSQFICLGLKFFAAVRWRTRYQYSQPSLGDLNGGLDSSFKRLLLEGLLKLRILRRNCKAAA